MIVSVATDPFPQEVRFTSNPMFGAFLRGVFHDDVRQTATLVAQQEGMYFAYGRFTFNDIRLDSYTVTIYVNDVAVVSSTHPNAPVLDKKGRVQFPRSGFKYRADSRLLLGRSVPVRPGGRDDQANSFIASVSASRLVYLRVGDRVQVKPHSKESGMSPILDDQLGVHSMGMFKL